MNLPAEQVAIRERCFHPSGKFVEFPKEDIEQSIPDRFEQIVRMFPDRLAVKTLTDALTYDALNKSTNRVAHTILAHSGTKEEPIAILLDKGARQMAAILGVLKAGKIYVPLDASYPAARTSYIVEDSGARLIVTDNQHLSYIEQLADGKRRVINLDEQDFPISTENPGLFISPNRASYVMYTSGSTGQPKGVVQNHRNVLHKVMQYTNAIHVCAEDRLTLFRSLSVSGSIRDLFGGLLTGAAVLPFELKEGGLVNRSAWLVREEITIYNAVASLFRNFVGTLAGDEEFPKIRLVKVSGEPVYKNDVELYKRHFSENCIMLNLMASSEAGTVRMYFIDKETQIKGKHVPVGYGVDDTEVFLLDEGGQRIGFNEIGEITVKSRYLPIGYWRRAELTRSAFLPDPEGGEERIYRTGDLGQIMPDGCLLHLRRKDLRVMIRGYSVEPVEVEMALLALSNIKEAVVGTYKAVAGDQQLVAYIVPQSRPGPAVNELRRILAESLPGYMIPASFVMLDAFPLMPNGKVDRQAFPAPENRRPRLDTPLVSPRNTLEAKLVQVWAEVLGFDKIGVHDNFFDLGGHSLAATRVILQVIKQFKLEIPLQSLFQSPTVAEMAKIIAAHQGNMLSEKEMESILTELESLSEEEAKKHLSEGSLPAVENK